MPSEETLCRSGGSLVVVVTRSFLYSFLLLWHGKSLPKKAQESFLGAASSPDPNPELTSTAPSSSPVCLDISSNSLSRKRWLFYTTDTLKKHFLERLLGFLNHQAICNDYIGFTKSRSQQLSPEPPPESPSKNDILDQGWQLCCRSAQQRTGRHLTI